MSERQLTARREVRRAIAAQTVLWVVRDCGAIRDYAVSAYVRHTTAAELLRRGLGALADHYQLAMPRAVWDANRPDGRFREEFRTPTGVRNASRNEMPAPQDLQFILRQ